MNILNRYLPKYPMLIVDGERVTPAQAQLIIVRTDGWHLTCRDLLWRRTVTSIMTEVSGIQVQLNEHDLYENYLAVDAFRAKIGGIELEYLVNSRIATSHIGGPHGWCDWNGRIFTDSYEIGKWPKTEEVFEEWKRIAAAFPFLTLRSQLVDDDVFDDEGNRLGLPIPLVEFRVQGGQVEVLEPTEQMKTTRWIDVEEEPSGRGCTPQKLRQALLSALV